VREDWFAGASCEMSAHWLTHNPQADEPQGGNWSRRHAIEMLLLPAKPASPLL
jgi:hypothetical protein